MSDKQQNSGQSSPAVSALRKQAEEQARTMVPISLPAQAPEDIQRMFHELRVHKIELEMQNEELRTAQARIEAKQARYFDIYDEAPVGYCTLSEQGVIQEANLTAATLLKTTRSELVTQPLSRFIFNEDQDIYYLHRKQLFETGEPQECELRLVKPDGMIYWAHLTATVAQVKDGSQVCRVVIIDITDRKRTEDALQESEERFKVLHNASFGGIAIHDQGVILECNQGLSEISGFGYDELIGMDGLLLIAEQSREVVMHNIHSVYEQSYEAFGLRKNGEEYPLRLEARNIPYKGKMVRVVEFRDITERKREEALLVERERLEFVIDGSRLGTWVWNVQTNETIFNETWAAMLGYTLEELTPSSVETWTDLTHPEDLKKAEALLALCLAEKTRDYTCELRMKHKDWRWVWILARGRIMTWDDTGKPLSIFGTHDDITERKHHEQQIATALSEKEVLLREIHHRVKNNLAAIVSLMDMQRRTFKNPNGQIVLTELSNRIRSMSLIHEKLYRADSLATIDFQDYTQALIPHLRTTFGSPDITCQVDAHGITIPLDLASPCGLIVNELVTNALKYAFPDGKPRPGNTDCQILVRLQRDKDTYTLTVADNGMGWPAEFDWTETKTLGMTLVRMLGQHQLDGSYVVDQENGTSITLTFTDRNKEVPFHISS